MLNEVAQLVPDYGVVFLDYLIGPHTGRAMAPLATIDLVGWDVHEAIVDNVYAKARDEAHALFKLPAFIKEGIAQGRLGDKTPERGGFYRRTGEKRLEVLDTSSGKYHEMTAPKPIEFVERMKALHRVGRYRESLAVLKEAEGGRGGPRPARGPGLCQLRIEPGRRSGRHQQRHRYDNELRVQLVATVGAGGSCWAPERPVELLKRYELKVPPLVERAAAQGTKLYAGNILDFGRTFVG